MRYVKIVMMALLAALLMAAPEIALAEVGHVRISENYRFVDNMPDAVYGAVYDAVIPIEVEIDDSGTREQVAEDDARRGVDYIFKLGSSGNLQNGLSLLSDGRITSDGQPILGNGSQTFYVRVESPDGELLAGRYLTVGMVSKSVSITVSNTGPYSYVYGETYKADFALSEGAAADGVELSDFTVKYESVGAGEDFEGDPETCVVDKAGTYRIRLTPKQSLYDKHCRFVAGQTLNLRVLMNTGGTLSLSDKEVVFGDEYEIAVVANPVNMQYKLEFEGIEGTEYPISEEKPSAVGTYLMTATVTDTNYNRRQFTARLRIVRQTINFTVSNNEVVYDGLPHKATVDAVKLPEEVTYEVKYINGSNEYSEVVDALEYAIQINLSDSDSYQVGTLNADVMKIAKRKVTFTVSEAEYYFDEANTEGYQATIRPDIDGVSYTVKYVNDGREYDKVTAAMVCDIVITMADALNNEAVISGAKQLVVKPKPVLLPIGGNSPAAQDANFSAANGYICDGVQYNPAAWGDGENLDLDKTTYFVTAAGMYSDAYKKLGCTVNGDAVETVLTIDGKSADTWTMSAGIHIMRYTAVYNGMQLSAERKLVVIPWAVGDVNKDGYVNVGDMRCLQGLQAADADLLYLYRVCDVDHDGTVGAEDGESIMNRFNQPIVSYYN